MIGNFQYLPRGLNIINTVLNSFICIKIWFCSRTGIYEYIPTYLVNERWKYFLHNWNTSLILAVLSKWGLFFIFINTETDQMMYFFHIFRNMNSLLKLETQFVFKVILDTKIFVNICDNKASDILELKQSGTTFR